MKYLHIIFFSLVLAATVFVPTAPAQAATTAELLAQVQLLKAQLQALEQQLLLRGTVGSSLSDCYTDIFGRVYCVTQTQTFTDNADNIDRIEVDFVGDIAQVRVEFDDDDTEFYAFEADTIIEMAELLSPELRVSIAAIVRLTDEVNNGHHSDDDDIRSIDVDFVGDDADVVVRFEDGDTDRFTLRDVDRDEDEVIEELADRYDEDEDDIENITNFDDDSNDDDDIESIDVDFVGDDADVTVRFEDGDTDRFTLHDVDDDEDEVIELLADRYNMDEDDIEDVIDFD